MANSAPQPTDTTTANMLRESSCALPRDGEKPRILVVDDERLNRDILTHMLSRSGYVVASATNGQEALDLLASQPFDLIVLDVVMPVLDGFACLSAIRAEYEPTRLPVIMATADQEQQTIVEAFRRGANDFVTKPLNAAVTLARIDTHIRLRQAGNELRQSEARYALAAKGANVGLYDWDLQRGKIYLSPLWKAMLGYADDELPSTVEEWMTRIHDDDSATLSDLLNASGPPGEDRLECELRLRHRDQHYRWMQCTGIVVRDATGKVCRIAGSLADITEGKVRDPLTGLPNRLHFEERLCSAAMRARRDNGSVFAVLFLDLDNFKLVNDSLGHHTGDLLLCSVAQRLEASLRATDSSARVNADFSVARQGGDEFAILLERLSNRDDAQLVAQRILAAMSEPFNVGEHEVSAGVSIGIAIGDAHEKPTADLLREADTAMYCAKKSGRGQFRVFNPEMQQQASVRLLLENDLRQAMRESQFFLLYQPILRLATNRIESFEALVRWQHPRNKVINPAEFVQALEESRMIRELGRHVLRAACQQSVAWCASVPQANRLTINVNCSVQELQHASFCKEVGLALRESNVDPLQIKLEVTESTIMADPEAICDVLTQIRNLGIGIGIDDFGTGYSSLAYLHRLPIDLLKIDRSFVANMVTCNDSKEIVQTILALGKSLGLDTVAEGVETTEQRDMLINMGCTHAQGYLFSRPISASDATAMLQQSYRPQKHGTAQVVLTTQQIFEEPTLVSYAY